jgi:SAM-dependent methyltransferase
MAEHGGGKRLARTAGRSAFGSDAAGVVAGRLGYPEQLFEAVFARAPTGSRILEIGAGTGLATRELLAHGPAELVVVEPDAALVGYLGRRFDDPRLTLVNATFPDAPVEGPFDLIVCAAAFHWMDPGAALARIRALLRPGGVWALWWNSYRNPGHGDAFARAVTPLLADVALPPSEGRDGHYSLDVALQTNMLEAAGFVDIHHWIFRRERSLGADEMRALYASYSYVRALPEAERRSLLDRIGHMVEREFGGAAPNVVLTALYIAGLAGG